MESGFIMILVTLMMTLPINQTTIEVNKELIIESKNNISITIKKNKDINIEIIKEDK